SPTPSPEPGYEFVPGVGYYKLHTAFKNWHAVRIICMQEGAHLAIINSFVEVSILKKLWTPHPKLTEDWTNNYAFIGVTDLTKTRNFVTIFDQPLNTTGYENWASGYPNFTGDCLVIARDGRIYETNCENKLAFLCETYFK
ncbi:Hemolymph lipopolysaccharide-binding protein, partial [Blattella germanica]